MMLTLNSVTRYFVNVVLVSYLAGCEQRFRKAADFVDYHGRLPVNQRRLQAEVYGEIKQKASTCVFGLQLRRWLRAQLDPSRPSEPYSFERHMIIKDVLHFLEHGVPLIPADLFDLPAFINSERRKKSHEQTTLLEAEARIREKERLQSIAERHRVEQGEMAKKLGIKQEILERLQGS